MMPALCGAIIDRSNTPAQNYAAYRRLKRHSVAAARLSKKQHEFMTMLYSLYNVLLYN